VEFFTKQAESTVVTVPVMQCCSSSESTCRFAWAKQAARISTMLHHVHLHESIGMINKRSELLQVSAFCQRHQFPVWSV